jgi:S-layer protein
MAFITQAQRTKLIELYVGYFNRAPEQAGLSYWANDLLTRLGQGKTEAQAFKEIADEFYKAGEQFGIFSAADRVDVFITKIYQNVLGRNQVDQAGMDYWKGKLNSGEVSRGQFVNQLIQEAKAYVAAAPANDPYKWVGTYLENRVAVADWFANNSANLTGQAAIQQGTAIIANSVTPTSAQNGQTAQQAVAAAQQASQSIAGQTFTLTTGIDVKTGTSGNDTFDGSVNANGVATLTSVDQLDGKGGIDYLIAGLAGGNIAAKLSNIENAEFITSAATTLDLVNTTGLQTVTMRNSSATLTVQNIGSTTSPSFKIQDQAADVNLLFANSALTGTNSFTLELNGAQSDGSGGADVLLQQQAGSDTSGLEELVIQSKGSGRNFLDSIDGQNAANTSTLSKLTVAGNQGLTVATNLAAGVRTIDLSGMTGEGLTAGFAAVQAVTVTGSGGADILTFGANNANSSIAAGAGNDVISIANFNANDSIDGGDGTDRLDISAANAEAVTANLANLANFEQLSLNTVGTLGATLNATRFGDISTVRLDKGTNGAYTVTLGAGSRTLTLAEPTAGTNAQLGGALIINDTGSASTDELSITNRDTDTVSTTNNFNGQNITINGFETVNLNTGATATVAQTVGTVTLNNDNLSGANTLNIGGANSLRLGGLTSNASGLLTVDASGLTGTAALTMSAAPTFSVSNGTVKITGGANADTLRGHASVGSTIDGGAGADTITGGTGADSITGGAGNDNITGAGGNDTITGDAGNDTIDVSGAAGAVSVSGGAGNDVVIVNGTLTATDTIAGGDDTDTLQITAAATAATAANVSGFEVLRLSAALTQGMEQFINNTGFTEVQYDANASITVTNAGASVNTLRVQNSGVNTFSFARLVDTATNALTVYVEDTGANGTAQTVATLTANDEETLTFNTGTTSDATANNGTGEALTITTLNAADLTSLTVTGQNAFTITNAIGGAANLATISATGLTANFSVDASTSTANMTVNGSNTGSNTITTGTGNDTITGGTAADTITGGNGEDVIYGGAGADSLTGGLGADQIFGEIGNDTLTGGAGNDTLTGGDGADVFVFGSDNTTLGGNNGVDRILDFVSGTDDIDVTNGLLAAVDNNVVTTTAGNANSIIIADNDVHYISMNGAAANLTTGGNATLSASDLTATTLTNLAAYLDERFVTANSAGNDAIFVINWTAGGSTTSYIYEFTDAGGNDTIEAAELALVGIVSRGDTVLTIGDIV